MYPPGSDVPASDDSDGLRRPQRSFVATATGIATDIATRPRSDRLHTEAELEALAETMPSLADDRPLEDAATDWLKEYLDPDEPGTTPQPGLLARLLSAVRTAVPAGNVRDGGTVIRPSNG
jgi:hypothetical protein